MYQVLDSVCPAMPADKPRYLMGVGTPQDLLNAIRRGIDLFDCVMPTRNGRNALAFTMDGPIRLRNACHRRDSNPIESGCPCECCTGFTRAYLHHLFQAEEMLGPTLLSLHNLHHYLTLMREARVAIEAGDYARFARQKMAEIDRREHAPPAEAAG